MAFAAWSFATSDKVELQSKSGRPLTRYFPELVDAVLEVKADRFALDGEIVIPQNGTFSFDALLQRIHPAASRVERLAAETPALLIVFDLLAGSDGRSLTQLPLRERRRALEAFAHQYLQGQEAIPIVTGDDQAERSASLARKRGRYARRHHRQTARSRIPLRRPHRNAEDQDLSQRRLRRRRLPLQ